MKVVYRVGIIFILSAGCSGYSQKTNEVIGIEFSSLARGYSHQVKITKDSIVQSLNSRGEEPQFRKRKIKDEEWLRILQTIKNINLIEVPDFKSPTMKRTYDGARHSTLSITISNGTTYVHSFDDEEPHEKLIPLMKYIRMLKE